MTDKLDRFVQGALLILERDPQSDIVAEHDQIWVGHERGRDTWTAEEQTLLDELGFFWEEDVESWSFLT